MVVAWNVMIVSGAATTGFLRAPLSQPLIAPLTYQIHRFAGTAVAVLGVVSFISIDRSRRRKWIGAALVAAAALMGWLCAALSLSPIAAAVHAFTAAFATVPLTALASASVSAAEAPAAAWKITSARAAFGLVGAQVVVGALLRHQQLGLIWHLLVGGVAATALLAPAMAVRQDAGTPDDHRQAAGWAIRAVVAQVALGVGVLIMILVGPPSLAVWLAFTIAHVAVGTLTLLSAAHFARVLSSGFRNLQPASPH